VQRANSGAAKARRGVGKPPDLEWVSTCGTIPTPLRAGTARAGVWTFGRERVPRFSPFSRNGRVPGRTRIWPARPVRRAGENVGALDRRQGCPTRREGGKSAPPSLRLGRTAPQQSKFFACCDEIFLPGCVRDRKSGTGAARATMGRAEGEGEVAAGILPASEPGFPARRKEGLCQRGLWLVHARSPEGVVPGGRMPPSLAGTDACRHKRPQDSLKSMSL
jgi:hypothetical protein